MLESKLYLLVGLVCLVMGFFSVKLGLFEFAFLFGFLGVWMGQDVNQCELLLKLGVKK